MTKKMKKRLIVGGIVVAGAVVGVGCAIKIKQLKDEIQDCKTGADSLFERIDILERYIEDKCGTEALLEVRDITFMYY